MFLLVCSLERQVVCSVCARVSDDKTAETNLSRNMLNPFASTQLLRDLADCLFPNVAMLSRSVALPQRSTTALLALTLAAALDRIDVTVRTRWQQLVCAFLWLPVGARRISATAMVADW